MRLFGWILLTVFLAVFLKMSEPGLGYSSSTYGALAKSIVLEGRWFSPRLGPELFDPFVEHPYLVLWMDALIFKIMGFSTQAIRMAGSLGGLAVFVALFFILRRRYDETTAFLGVVALLTVNQFMHYISSGWLDMPMIGWVWLAFWCLQDFSWKRLLAGGLFLGFAVLAKGVSAMAVLPVAAWVLWRSPRQFPLFAVASLAPLLAFSVLHYQSEGFLFWARYIERQLHAQETWQSASHDVFWYVKEIFQHGHVVTLLSLFGLRTLWQRGQRDWCVLIVAQVALHTAVYSLSVRHHGQYVIPVFPWLCIAAAVQLRAWLPDFNVERAARWVAGFAVAGFVIVDLLPIQVHSGQNHPFRAYQTALQNLKDSGHVYFYGKLNEQASWEDMASDIPWYWSRVPHIGDTNLILQHLRENDSLALGVWPLDVYENEVKGRLRSELPEFKLCLWDEMYALVAHQSICSNEFQARRWIPESGR